MNKYYYQNWFSKLIAIFIDIFFVLSTLATLYVFTSPLSGFMRTIAYIVFICIYCAVFWFFKDKAKEIIKFIFNKLNDLNTKKAIIIISITMIFFKILYSSLFGFDPSPDGDIEIYNIIADYIIRTGSIHFNVISHLLAVALHFVPLKLLNIPLDIGIFVVFFIGTIVNFLSFKEIIGIKKSFILVMIYVLMPSSCLISFCYTHELFLYLYLSLFFYVFNKMLRNENNKLYIVYILTLSILLSLSCMVNPGGYVLYVILGLTILFSNIPIKKKLFIVLIVIVSLLSSKMVHDYLQINDYDTTINTYTILIHGSNPESLGQQVDGYPLKQMRMYIHSHTYDFSDDGFIDAAKHVLLNQYYYLFTHPVTLLKLIMNKVYILWSGVHYPMELGFHYNAYSTIVYYLLLIVNTLIYLMVLTIMLMFIKNKKNNLFIDNYGLELLGVFAVTMLSIVANKYGIYVTIFIFFLVFNRIDMEDGKN